MSERRFRLSALSNEDRASFCCGNETLDRYFRQQVTQDIKRRISRCFIAKETVSGAIAGYYTLSAADVLVTSVPQPLAKHLPRYPTVPVARLGRLAVDKDFQGMQLGGALLFDAVDRVARSDVAAFAMIVEAIDGNAVSFYRHLGFTAYGSAPGLLIAPLGVLLKARGTG